MSSQNPPKLERSQVIHLNNLIAKYASRKDLISAMEVFEQELKHSANTHSYCAIINANIRCGNMIGALKAFKQLKERKFEPDVVRLLISIMYSMMK